MQLTMKTISIICSEIDLIGFNNVEYLPLNKIEQSNLMKLKMKT